MNYYMMMPQNTKNQRQATCRDQVILRELYIIIDLTHSEDSEISSFHT